jgi:hypothetical protein
LALIPTVLHTYLGATVVDGRRTADIPIVIGQWTAQPTARDAGWGERRFESYDWFERRYRARSDEAVLTVLRSYDLKRLYHHPELDIAYGVSFLSHDVMTLPQWPDKPVHVLQTAAGTSRQVVIYALLYADHFVHNPITLQIRTAGELLVSRRQPMTLFFLHDPEAGDLKDVTQLPAARLLFGAIEAFLPQRSDKSQ